MIQYNEYCPVCGYFLGFLPWDDESASDEICLSCGIQFGYTDMASGDELNREQLYLDWRSNWINEGMPWNKGRSSPPPGWSGADQLKNIENK